MLFEPLWKMIRFASLFSNNKGFINFAKLTKRVDKINLMSLNHINLEGQEEGIAMLPSIGRFLRKLRIDNGEILKDMAEALGVSSAFLSAVENGKKKMPEGWIEKLKTMILTESWYM